MQLHTLHQTQYIQVQHIKKTYLAALASCIIQCAQRIMGSLVKTQPGVPLLVNNSECHKQWLFNAQCTPDKETNYFKRHASTHWDFDKVSNHVMEIQQWLFNALYTFRKEINLIWAQHTERAYIDPLGL